MKKVLILSNDKIFSRCVQVTLEDSGFYVNASSSAPSDMSLYDAVICDEGKQIPPSLSCGVIYTSYTDIPEITAEFYLKRPISEGVLVRTVSLACRGESEMTPEKFILDKKRSSVSFNGKSISLTHREFSLLSLLMKTPDKAVSRDEIIERVFDGTATGNADAVYVNYLRKKLTELCGRNPISSVRGYGYKFCENPLSAYYERNNTNA